MSEIKSRPYLSVNWQMRNTIFFKYAILIYRHFDMLLVSQNKNTDFLFILT